MTLLTNMNAHMCAISESLKRLHEHNDSCKPNARKAEFANKAKLLAEDSTSRTEADIELLPNGNEPTEINKAWENNANITTWFYGVISVHVYAKKYHILRR